jgi:hypothetical protein
MERLFNNTPGETYTDTANRFDDVIRHALTPIIESADRQGICLRDIAYITTGVANELVSLFILRRALETRKSRRVPFSNRNEDGA